MHGLESHPESSVVASDVNAAGVADVVDPADRLDEEKVANLIKQLWCSAGLRNQLTEKWMYTSSWTDCIETRIERLPR